LDTEVQRIDRKARAEATALIRRYLGNDILAAQLEEDWPEADDAAVQMIGYEILASLGGGRLNDEFPPEFREILCPVLVRCELFLGTALPYAWGSLRPGSCLTLGCTTVVLILVAGTIYAVLNVGTIGLGLFLLTVAVALLSIRPGMMAKADLKKIRSMATGDLHFWPFESHDDLQAVRHGRDPVEAAEAKTPGLGDPEA